MGKSTHFSGQQYIIWNHYNIAPFVLYQRHNHPVCEYPSKGGKFAYPVAIVRQ